METSLTAFQTVDFLSSRDFDLSKPWTPKMTLARFISRRDGREVTVELNLTPPRVWLEQGNWFSEDVKALFPNPKEFVPYPPGKRRQANIMKVNGHKAMVRVKVSTLDLLSLLLGAYEGRNLNDPDAAQLASNLKTESSTVVAPEESSVAHMLSMATQACDQSGKVQSMVFKEKAFMFEDDADFRRHVSDLLVRQENRCAITNLPLQFLGMCDDEERLASLDRIDPNGHYQRDNLQVVCRFINRWKSDDSDQNFRRLIGLLRL